MTDSDILEFNSLDIHGKSVSIALMEGVVYR